jgi:hypothetical protein
LLGKFNSGSYWCEPTPTFKPSFVYSGLMYKTYDTFIRDFFVCLCIYLCILCVFMYVWFT